jgi:hypothetical protein
MKGSSCEELYPQVINKTERLICEECVAEFFEPPKIGNCSDCSQELVEGYYWSRPDKNLMFCADCGQSVLDEEKEEEAMGAEDKDAPTPLVAVAPPTEQETKFLAYLEECYQEAVAPPKAKAPRKKVKPLNADKCVWETTGCMDENFMKTFLLEKMNANQKRDATKLFKADPEGFIEYRNISFRGATDGDNGLFYSEIWLLDLSTECGGKMSPIVVNRINTSSAYAMSRCGMDREEDEDEDSEEKPGRFKYTELPKMFKKDAINGARFWESVRHHFV